MKTKNIYYFLLSLVLSSTVYSQTDTFTMDGTLLQGSTDIYTETKSGVTLTITDNSNLGKTNYGDVGCTDTYVVYSNSSVTIITITFDQDVNIGSMCALSNSGTSGDSTWIFTAKNNNSTVATKNQLVDDNFGTSVDFGTSFVGIDEIEITLSGGGSYDFAFDNIYMDAALPVELTSFYSVLTLSSVKLKWETATEVNNYGFEVHRSQNSEVSSQNVEDVWEVISFVEGHGNSNSPKKYVFEDKTYVAGKVYKYRLKQIDFDGAFEYSDELIVETEVPEKAELAQNYPNPFNPGTTIKFSVPESDFASLKVYNSIGEEVAVLINENLEPGFYTYLFDGSNLASGAYVYKLETAGRVITKKMLLVK